MQYQYSTGREYNGAQVLAINAPALPDDLLADVRVEFRDASRGIAGAVTLMVMECATTASMGAGVLREYDAGRYTLLRREHAEILISHADAQAIVAVITTWDDGDTDSHSERSFQDGDYLADARGYAEYLGLPIVETTV